MTAIFVCITLMIIAFGGVSYWLQRGLTPVRLTNAR